MSKKKQTVNPKADPRIGDARIACVFCKHAIHIANPYGFSEQSNCSAYPTGIPYAIQKEIDKHEEVLPSQEGTDVYESRQVYDLPDGRNYRTWEGEWVTLEEAENIQ